MNIKIRSTCLPHYASGKRGRPIKYQQIYSNADKLKVGQWFEVPLPDGITCSRMYGSISQGLRSKGYVVKGIKASSRNGKLIVYREKVASKKGASK